MNIRTGILAALALVVAGCTSTDTTDETTAANSEITGEAVEPPPPMDEHGEVCGGIVGAVCVGEGETTYCKKPEGQCSAEAGVCAPIGDPICPEVYDPVCGCDGVTYGNSCEAEAAGANIASKGECSKPEDDVSILPVANTGEACHGKAGIQCGNENDFCKFPDGTCNNPDMLGVCTTKSGPICTTDYIPVCGCDGNTYSNDCVASSNGVSVLYQGECGDQAK